MKEKTDWGKIIGVSYLVIVPCVYMLEVPQFILLSIIAILLICFLLKY